jgi:hypothetical protein
MSGGQLFCNGESRISIWKYNAEVVLFKQNQHPTERKRLESSESEPRAVATGPKLNLSESKSAIPIAVIPVTEFLVAFVLNNHL